MSRDPAKKKQMFSFIEQWKETDQTQMEFCHEKGIKYSTFLYWMKVYRRSEKQDHRFLPVEIVSSESNRQQEEEPKKPKAELEFDSGIILRIY